MHDASLKKERGEAISGTDEMMLQKAERYNFNMDLIKNKIIENFPYAEVSTGEDLINAFSSYLQGKTGRDSGFVSKA